MTPPRRVALPIYGGSDEGPRPATRQAVFDALLAGVEDAKIVDHVGRAVDALWAAIATDPAAGPSPACAKGCAHCCHQRVEATAPEVLALARHVASLAPSVRRTLSARVHATASTLEGHSSRMQHLAQVPCALLDPAGACSVYPARPLACRRGHSTDAEVCRAVHEEPTLETSIPTAPSLSWHTSAAVIGYLEGLALADRPPHHYELHAALDRVLQRGEEATEETEVELLEGARSRSADELFDVLGSASGSPPARSR